MTALLQTQLNKPELARSIVTDVSKKRTKYLVLSNEAAGSKVRHRNAQWENLERAVMQWIGHLSSRNAVLADNSFLKKPNIKCSCKCWQPKPQRLPQHHQSRQQNNTKAGSKTLQLSSLQTAE